MNYYSLLLCFMLSIVGNGTEQFVELKDAEITVEKDNDYVTITLPFEVLEPYHIQSNSEVSEELITTEITLKENNAYEIVIQEFSLKKDETISLNGAMHKVISNQFEVTVVLKLNENTSNVKLEGELYYQACSDKQCLFPRGLNFQISI